MDDTKLNQIIDARALAVIKDYVTRWFTAKKVTDTPTDALSVVNRKFVTGNGVTRPPSPVLGQSFLDTNLNVNGIPIWYGPHGWTNSSGTLV